MKTNKHDLSALRDELDTLKRHVNHARSGRSAGELAPRLAKLSEYVRILLIRRIWSDLKTSSRRLAGIIQGCKSLEEYSAVKRFFQAEKLASKIVGTQQSVQDAIQNFVVYVNVGPYAAFDLSFLSLDIWQYLY